MRRAWTFVQEHSLLELTGLALLLGVYWWMVQQLPLSTGQEIHLLQVTREWSAHPMSWEAGRSLPVSPLLSVLLGAGFQVFAQTLLTARTVMLGVFLVFLAVFYLLGTRLYNNTAGLVATGFALATWGFFSNSYAANGAVLYVMLACIAFYLFFDWFDQAGRSKTLARSLYMHFILFGVTLGLMFCTAGLPGLLFPVAVASTTVYWGPRPGMAADVRYPWLLLPLGGIIALWSLVGMLSTGISAFWSAQIRFGLNVGGLGAPLVDLLPVLPLLIPALLSKDMWNRCLITYSKTPLLLVPWGVAALLFLVVCPDYHEAFSLLVIAPFLLWLGFYFNEVFRNPILPAPLQWTLDAMVFGGLAIGVALTILTFQLVPPETMGAFMAFIGVLIVSAILLLLFKDQSISRMLPVYLIPCSLLLCILARHSVAMWFQYTPDEALYRHIPQGTLAPERMHILQWSTHPERPTVIRLLTPLRHPVTPVNTLAQVESRIQTRQGPLYVILPESQYYQLSPAIREMGYRLTTQWQWRQPLGLLDILKALAYETVDFTALTEPVLLFCIPETPDR